MTQFVVLLSAATAADADRIGPKAANLAALAQAGLPTPGGFCLTADAYRAQIAALGLDDLVRRFAKADLVQRRRLSVEIRLGLYEQPVAAAILEPQLVQNLVSPATAGPEAAAPLRTDRRASRRT